MVGDAAEEKGEEGGARHTVLDVSTRFTVKVREAEQSTAPPPPPLLLSIPAAAPATASAPLSHSTRDAAASSIYTNAENARSTTSTQAIYMTIYFNSPL